MVLSKEDLHSGKKLYILLYMVMLPTLRQTFTKEELLHIVGLHRNCILLYIVMLPTL